MLGSKLGVDEGLLDGVEVGLLDGVEEGKVEGKLLGKVVGKKLGISDGAAVHDEKNNSNSNVFPVDSSFIKFNPMLSAFGSSLISI